MKKIPLQRPFVLLAFGLLFTANTAFALLEANTETNISTGIKTTLNSSSTSGASANLTSSSSIKSEAVPPETSSKTGAATQTRTSISLPLNINAMTDLTAYENSIMVQEDAVAEIDTTTDDEVSVTWKHEGKLFALFPVTVKSETIVDVGTDNTAQVTTSMPWWSIFVTDLNTRETEVEERLKQSTILKAYINAQSSAQAKADMVYEIVKELSTDTETEANLEAQIR